MRSRISVGYSIIDACRNGLHCGIPYNLFCFGAIKVYELNLGFEFCLIDEAPSELGDPEQLPTVISSDDEVKLNDDEQKEESNNSSQRPVVNE